MGNTSQCCSSDTRCCGGKDYEGITAPVGAQPIANNELAGMDDLSAPGMAMKAAPDCCKENKESNIDLVCPGGDSAAGGGTSPDDKKEYQYVTYEDNSTYVGQISEGKRDGHGIWQSRTGQYEGQWQADSQHGHGRQTWSDGRVYDGQFFAGRFSGSGRMVWHTSKGMLMYEGQYKEDLKDGLGKFVWADGRTYDGQWQKGKRHGRGMYMNTTCQRRIGFWRDDKFERWESADKQTEGVTPAAGAGAAPTVASAAPPEEAAGGAGDATLPEN